MTVMEKVRPGAEFEFTSKDHARIAREIYQDFGIVLPATKAHLVYARLAPLVRVCGDTSVNAYLDRLDRDAEERARALDALTTNHTSFFRESHHFDSFVSHLWPGLAERLQRGGRVRLWSAACSNGAEPYSWVMAAVGANRAVAQRVLAQDFRVLATDVSPAVVATARAGTYPINDFAPVPAMLRRSWISEGKRQGSVDEALRNAVSFRQLNLLKNWPMQGKFDAIFCRNVMIYFDKDTNARLQERMTSQLAVGGMLCIGHSERLAETVLNHYRAIGRTSYIKVKD